MSKRIARLALAAFGAAAVTSTTSHPAAAQQAAMEPQARWELTIPGGQLLPTGAQRGAIQRGGLTAVQISYVPRPAFALMATFGWARSRDVAAVGQPKLDVFMYDVGVEARAADWIGSRVTFSPFAGVGGGARSYNYRSLRVDATHNLAAYASVGGEIGMGRVHLRLEARDYVAGFKALDGQGRGNTRNDVALMFGLRLGAN